MIIKRFTVWPNNSRRLNWCRSEGGFYTGWESTSNPKRPTNNSKSRSNTNQRGIHRLIFSCCCCCYCILFTLLYSLDVRSPFGASTFVLPPSFFYFAWSPKNKRRHNNQHIQPFHFHIYTAYCQYMWEKKNKIILLPASSFCSYTRFFYFLVKCGELVGLFWESKILASP